MKCSICGAPMSKADRTCPGCDRSFPVPGVAICWRKEPEAPRGSAVVAGWLGTPAWMVALLLCVVLLFQGAWWHRLSGLGVLAASLGLLLASLRRMDGRGRARMMTPVVFWSLIALVGFSCLGFYLMLAIFPIGVMAAVATILGGVALYRHRDGDASARVMALLGFSSLYLLAVALCLTKSAYDANRRVERPLARPQGEKAMPKRPLRHRVRLRGGRSITFRLKAYCVVAPPDESIPRAEAGETVEPIAPEDIRPGTFLLAVKGYERIVRIERPGFGDPHPYALIRESDENQPITVYPGQSYWTPRPGRPGAQPIPVGELKPGMLLQLHGREETYHGGMGTGGELVTGPVRFCYEEVVDVGFAP